ncbi:hypothetical protein PLUTE_a4371 [Pseudoalteromonas luteoviolacea DSM 6061]|nr:hypothetical protein [Pseudoalteromonas luteoviolacea DSM 6061]
MESGFLRAVRQGADKDLKQVIEMLDDLHRAQMIIYQYRMN